MSESGRVFRGVRTGLLAGSCVLALTPAESGSRQDGAVQLAQAGVMSSQPRSDQPPAPTAVPGPASSLPNTPAQPVGPSAGTPAAIAPPAAAPAPFSLTQNATGFTATNLRLAFGPSVYNIPRAEIRGSSLSRDELANVLDPQSSLSLADRVARLSASEIAIPEMRAETTVGSARQVAVYRDLRVVDVVSGRISSMSAANGAFESEMPEGASRGTFARLDLSEVDAGLMVSLLEPSATSAASELRKIYGAFSIGGLLSEGPNGARTRMARVAGRDFRARPTKEGWLATAQAFAGQTNLNTASPAERSRVVGALVDIFEAFEIGSLEASGIEFTNPGAKDGSGQIRRIAYTASQRGGEFRVEGVDAGGIDGRLRLADFSIGGIALGPMLAAARELSGRTDALSSADFRRLIPLVGSLRFSGFDLQAKGDGGKADEGVAQVAIGGLELLADKPVENIPTDLRLTVRNLSLPLSPDNPDPMGQQIRALGYERIDASLTASLAWNEPGQELVLREISAQGAGMGSLNLRGIVGNVSKDSFGTDQALAAIAWMGATAKSIDLEVQNGGLFERMLAREAASKGRSVDDLRREYGMAAVIGIPIMLGNAPAAKALGQAVARFVAKPGRLSVQARAREAGGLGVADFIGAPDPAALLDKVEISASAE